MQQRLEPSRMADNISRIHRLMAEAALSAGRRPGEVLLCAACKGRSLDKIRESAALPVDLFGENREQELAENSKAGAYLQKPCHFIGRLQTNKVKKVVGLAAVIQSVGSLHLLEAIHQEAERQRITQDILLQVNIGGEASKGGVPEGELWPILEAAAGMGHLRVRGLMAIPPPAEYGADNRHFFSGMRSLLEQARDKGLCKEPPGVLSMGMSDDFEAAIREGATIVRIGRGIYGDFQE